ncbi:MAG: M20/M25/M40 family metallo-hydrolase, partial [Panacibacter sp.]
RLTGSPGFMRAANYAKQQLAEWGLVNTTLDEWGDFGKSWELKKSYAGMIAPYYRPINAFPKAWCSGTNGLKNADVLLVTSKDSAGLDSYRGKLAGKIIIVDRDFTYHQSFTADATRFTDAELDSMSNIKTSEPDTTALAARRRAFFRNNPPLSMINEMKKIARQEGAIAILSMITLSHDGTLFVQGGGSYKITDPENFTDIQIGLEDYMTIVRLLHAGVPVKMEMDVATKFYTDNTKAYNVIAEIPGTDPKLKDEVVMLGAHLDSWQGATGATDNGAGSMVMMEAVRILKALNIQPKRTIRIALWSGEEEGLLGSKGYVKKTLGDPATMQLQPAHDKFDVYFNVDNGTGKIRGIYLQGNEACRKIFSEWFKPFDSLGAKTITIDNTGGTDHLSFNAVGLPGFQFIQDPIEYFTRTHHTSMDSYDHLIADDLKQMSAVVAAFVYDAAQRNEKIPHKPLPKPKQ